ncbi:MAG TPA: hypothetical protein PKY82_25255 [Pyrinomonadaceae bacterium]|nr:hypothetical protein [Pyrinomonadaceae bacterium]
MKICKYCQQEKTDDSFEVCKVIAGKTYYRQKCKDCKRSVRVIRRKKTRKWLDEYKKSLACERCDFSDFRALEFHHSNPNQKDFNVADMIRSGASIQTILNEIEKCEILCSNCHQIEHYEKRD